MFMHQSKYESTDTSTGTEIGYHRTKHIKGGSGSKSMIQNYGSKDPDPKKNIKRSETLPETQQIKHLPG
jgi:hypothetical protein